MNDKIPKEIYTMTGVEPKYIRLDSGIMEKRLYMASRPGLDMSDLKVIEELGLHGEVTDDQILEASERLDKQVREAVWEFLKELTGGEKNV